ncbi:MAG: DUF2065 family protein [Hyphomicrobiaceae bacterium]|jgi:uncharacterized protein YjeT (DUF2065 family)
MSSDLLVGIGLVLVIEGALWAAFPRLAVSLLKAAMVMSEGRLRGAGLAAAVAGLALVWLVRG